MNDLKNTLKFAVVLWAIVTAWSNMGELELYVYFFLFGAAVIMTFYFFVRFILFIDDCFSNSEPFNDR